MANKKGINGITYDDIETWHLDDEKNPLEKYADEIDIEAMEHKTAFTVIGSSRGKTWESNWLIPKDIGENDWMEIQRMLKLAMTTLCRLPIDDAVGVVDPERFNLMRKQEKARLEKIALLESQRVFGEPDPKETVLTVENEQ